MRGGRYQALIVTILLLTALPYTPLMNIQSAQHVAPGEQQRDASFPEMDSDGDGLNDSYEMELGFDPFDFDSDGDGIPDGLEREMLEDLAGSGLVPPNIEDLIGPDGDLDGDGRLDLREQSAVADVLEFQVGEPPRGLQTTAMRRRRFRKGRAKLLDQVGRRRDGQQIRLGEVTIVVRVGLRAPR